ncbi:MAG: hypothetical protein PVF83_03265 [Anaerolineales bacterium]|jgi:hypothetical protein
MSEDTGWECKSCGNFNVRTNTCPKCGNSKDPIPNHSSITETTTSEQSEADEFYRKGFMSFVDLLMEVDTDKGSGHLSRAQGYLTMAYKAAGEDVEEKKGIAGLMALILAMMEDCKSAEKWARAELSINPTHVFARLAWYFVELDKWIGHKGFVLHNDGSGFGIFANILTTGVDVGRVQSKKNAVKIAAIEAAKAIEYKTQTDDEQFPLLWLLWSWLLLIIIENMWENNLREQYLCNVLLSLQWNRFTKEEISGLEESIEDITVAAHGFLGRSK